MPGQQAPSAGQAPHSGGGQSSPNQMPPPAYQAQPPPAQQPGQQPPFPGSVPPPSGQPGYPGQQPGYYGQQPGYYGHPGYHDPYAKSRVVAGILGILVGGLGIHRFYLGYVGIGIAQIVVTFVTFGAGSLWGFIEGILYLVSKTGTFAVDAHGRPLRE